jgi:hypothetical protein
MKNKKEQETEFICQLKCQLHLKDSIKPDQGFYTENHLVIHRQEKSDLNIFNANSNQFESCVEFDCPIEGLCSDSDGRFLVVGDKLGTIHLLSLADYSICYSQQITTPLPTGTFVQLFFNVVKDSGELMVILRNGSMITLFGIPINGLDNRDIDGLDGVQTVVTDSGFESISCASSQRVSNGWIYGVFGHVKEKYAMKRWISSSSSSRLAQIDTLHYFKFTSSVAQCIVLDQKNLMIALTIDGILTVFDLCS